MSYATSDPRAWLVRLLVPALLSLLAACGSLEMDLPSEFLTLEDGVELRAVTPDDARVWGRDFVEANDGTLEFWADTLQHDLVEARGYQLVAAGEAKDGDGHAGRWLQCAATVDGERRGYLVALFPYHSGFLFWSANRLRVLEFTAQDDVFTRLLPAVRDGLGTLRR